MKVKRIVVGPLEENCYILNIDNNYLIIDPGDEYIKILVLRNSVDLEKISSK